MFIIRTRLILQQRYTGNFGSRFTCVGRQLPVVIISAGDTISRYVGIGTPVAALACVQWARRLRVARAQGLFATRCILWHRTTPMHTRCTRTVRAGVGNAQTARCRPGAYRRPH
eukprot:890957-Pleurochrysis_carterae.AAC.3